MVSKWVLGYLAGHIADAAHPREAGWCAHAGEQPTSFDEDAPAFSELMACLRSNPLLQRLRKRFAEAVCMHAPHTAYFASYLGFSTRFPDFAVPPGIFIRPNVVDINVQDTLAVPDLVLPQWEPIVVALQGREHEHSAMHIRGANLLM